MAFCYLHFVFVCGNLLVFGLFGILPLEVWVCWMLFLVILLVVVMLVCLWLPRFCDL